MLLLAGLPCVSQTRSVSKGRVFTCAESRADRRVDNAHLDTRTKRAQVNSEGWLSTRATPHVKKSLGAAYSIAIHTAVIRSGGRDHFADKFSNWSVSSR